MALSVKHDYITLKALENIINTLENDMQSLSMEFNLKKDMLKGSDDMRAYHIEPLMIAVKKLTNSLKNICMEGKHKQYLELYSFLRNEERILTSRLGEFRRFFYSQDNKKNIVGFIILFKKLEKDFDLEELFRNEKANVYDKIETARQTNKLNDWGLALNLDDLSEYRIFSAWERIVLEKIDIMKKAKYNNVEKAIGKINYYIADALRIELEYIFGTIFDSNYDKTIFLNKNLPIIIENTLKNLYPHIKQIFDENF